MRRALDVLEALIKAADAAAVSPTLLRSAGRALADLEDELTATADPRKIATLEKAHRLLAAREAGASRQQLIERFGIGKTTYDRWLALAPASRASSSGDSTATKEETD